MLCPKCKKEIRNADVISKCWQKASVDKTGQLYNYGSVENINETISVNCSNCDADITTLVKQ